MLYPNNQGKLNIPRPSISRESRLTEFIRGYTTKTVDVPEEEASSMIGGSMLYNIGQMNEPEKEVDIEKSRRTFLSSLCHKDGSFV